VHHHHPAHATTAYVAPERAAQPLVLHESTQPVSLAGDPARHVASTASLLAARRAHAARLKAALAKSSAAALVPAVATVAPVAAAPTPAPAAKPVEAQPVQVTEVTTETTQLPTQATTEPVPPAEPTATTPPTTTTTTPSVPAVAPPTVEPVPVPDPAPAGAEEKSKRIVRRHGDIAGGSEAPAAAIAGDAALSSAGDTPAPYARPLGRAAASHVRRANRK